MKATSVIARLAAICPALLATSGYAGLVAVDADLIAQPDIPGYGAADVWRVYVTFDDPTDTVLAVFGDPVGNGLSITTGGTYYQDPLAGDIDHNGGLDGIPGAVHDTYITIGSTDFGVHGQTSQQSILAPAGPGIEESQLVITNGTWFRTPSDPAIAGVAGDPGEWRVLIGQFTVQRGEWLVGLVNIAGTIDGGPATSTGLMFNADPSDPPDGSDPFDPGDPMAALHDADDIVTGGSADERLGWAVRYVGDVDQDDVQDLAIGVPRDDAAGNNAGRVIVQSGADGSVLFEVTGAAAGDQFGYAVDGAGDWNGDGFDDVIVGAPMHDAAGGNAGAVYVYSGQAPHGLLWSATGEAAGDRFGFSVAGFGDRNNDGNDDVLVGAPYNDAGGNKGGRAYVYLGDSGSLWKRRTGEAAGDNFGRVVESAGDVNGDGRPDFMVAAPFNDFGGGKAGKINVYSGANGSLLRTRLGESAGDRFGWSATAIGDVNDDGFDDILVGATHDDDAGSNAGAATAVSGADDSVLYKLVGSAPGDFFGWAVTGARDWDGDDVGEVMVAATRSDAAGSDSGRVFVYSGVDGVFLTTIDGQKPGSRFGESLDADRSASDDNELRAAVGSWRFKSSGLNKRGRVYVFEVE